MSVLDMFASALGAFILITVLLFPWFNRAKQFDELTKDTKAAELDLAKAQAKLRSATDQSEGLQRELRKGPEFRTALVACTQRASACKAVVAKVFLVIGIEWEATCDVDLYVTDPDLRVFYHKNTTHEGSRAELSVDTRSGPGVEVWQTPEAKIGDYTIEYVVGSPCPALPEGSASTIQVDGWILDRGTGLQKIPQRSLRRGDRTKAAVVLVTNDGIARIR